MFVMGFASSWLCMGPGLQKQMKSNSVVCETLNMGIHLGESNDEPMERCMDADFTSVLLRDVTVVVVRLLWR